METLIFDNYASVFTMVPHKCGVWPWQLTNVMVFIPVTTDCTFPWHPASCFT